MLDFRSVDPAQPGRLPASTISSVAPSPPSTTSASITPISRGISEIPDREEVQHLISKVHRSIQAFPFSLVVVIAGIPITAVISRPTVAQLEDLIVFNDVTVPPTRVRRGVVAAQIIRVLRLRVTAARSVAPPPHPIGNVWQRAS